MSIFDVPEKSREDKIKESVDALKDFILVSEKNREQAQITAFNCVWNNPDGFTAQEIINGFGKDAATLFDLSYKNELAIKEVNPDWVFLVPPLPFVINQDGTVTITEVI